MKKKSIDFGNVKSLKTAAVGCFSFYFIIKSKKFWLFAKFLQNRHFLKVVLQEK